jgi:membrane protein
MSSNALEQSGQNRLPGVNHDPVFVNAVNNFRNRIESSGQDRLLKDI